MTLEDNVLDNYSKLNDTDLYIWDYINNNRMEIDEKNLTITKLSKELNVSSTTILRFANKIGLDGYSELKYLIKNENTRNPIRSGGDDFEMACNAIIKYITELKEKDYSQICKIILESEKLCVWGSGSIQQSVAMDFSKMILSCNKLMYVIQDQKIDKEIYDMVDSKDTFVLISLSGNSPHTIDFARKLKLRGATIISITESQHNELALLSDESLYIYSSKINFSKNYPQYQTTSLFYVLIELLVLKIREYKNLYL
ncbi:MAG: MurR/RpiR family transcriptional regulator [Anaerococcus sp.]|nr:MurR/RpiR family transcriptional regulator [Peptoniphilaceae bacterium]MDY3055728.1 MurR/RpiR family transcriptional regulator [Anaerococcus sp.]